MVSIVSFGQPFAGLLFRLLARQDFPPDDFAPPAVSRLDSAVKHATGRSPDIRASAVPFNERNDGSVRHLDFVVSEIDLLPTVVIHCRRAPPLWQLKLIFRRVMNMHLTGNQEVSLF